MSTLYRPYEVVDANGIGQGHVFRMLTESDTARVYRHWMPGRYDAKCSCCWHGFAHTVGVHAFSVGCSEDELWP